MYCIFYSVIQLSFIIQNSEIKCEESKKKHAGCVLLGISPECGNTHKNSRVTRLSATADKDGVDPPQVPSTRKPGLQKTSVFPPNQKFH